MQVFEKDGKVNFVDENDVFLGYDMNQDCCERADWFIADTPQTNSPEVRGKLPDLKKYVFDLSFFQQVDGGEFDAGGMAIFRIVSGTRNEKFIHIFNSHNGYYGHGFNFVVGGKIAREGTL